MRRSTTSYTSYEVVYGCLPPNLLQHTPKTAKVQTLEENLYDHDVVLHLLRDHFVKAQERMKVYANRKRKKRQFQIGDWVLLKLQPYRQRTLGGSMPHKLSARYTKWQRRSKRLPTDFYFLHQLWFTMSSTFRCSRNVKEMLFFYLEICHSPGKLSRRSPRRYLIEEWWRGIIEQSHNC